MAREGKFRPFALVFIFNYYQNASALDAAACLPSCIWSGAENAQRVTKVRLLLRRNGGKIII
jgi:hypothetical protein